MKNSYKMLFFYILMMGTLISISANSWLGAWMGLEINLLAFIPLMKDDKLMSTESSLKYFLTQTLASSVLLFAMILYLLNLYKYSNFLMEMLIFSSLVMKSGSAPFHFWFPSVLEGLTWINVLILMTWQKIAPLMLMSYVMYKSLMMISIIFSSLIGALGGLNQTSLRKLMAYSSINHLGWMMAAMFNSNLMWSIYFLIYSFLSFSMIIMFNLFKVSHINQLFTLFFFSKSLKFFLFLNLLSLGGLPPFLGFFPKWLIIQTMIFNNQLLLLTFMVMMTLITLYFYIRLCYSAFMLNYFEINWLNFSMFNPIDMKNMLLFSTISTFGLLLIIPMYFYF